MNMNQRGGSLVHVLLVIIVLSVLGFALVGGVINENKRTVTTEANVQARYLAESGLTYFEKDFTKQYEKELLEFIANNNSPGNSLTKTKINNFNNDFLTRFLNRYSTFTKVEDNKIEIKAKKKDDEVVVTSKGEAGTSEKVLTAYYLPTFSINTQNKVYEMADFTKGGIAVDFANRGLLKLGLANIAELGALRLGLNKEFYPVPNDSVLSLDLTVLLGLGIPKAEEFNTMKQNRVVATRRGTVLSLGLLSDIIKLNLLDFQLNQNTNVIIHGGHDILDVATIVKVKDYQDIDFKKFAVMGNAIIKQEKWGNIELLDKLPVVSGLLDLLGLNATVNKLVDGLGLARDKDSHRKFTFDEGLYVHQSLTIGGTREKDFRFLLWTWKEYEPQSSLKLRGNIGVKEDLHITKVTLDIGGKDKKGEHEGIYVLGDAYVKNANVNNNGAKANDDYDFRIFSEGKITFDNTGDLNCNTYRGVFMADEIEFKSKQNQKIKVYGAIIGDIKGSQYLEYHQDDALVEKVLGAGGAFVPKGRSFKGSN